MPKRFYTPPEFAELLGIRSDKVLTWIHRGELVAINCASDPNGERPRWRIPDDEAGKFLLRRRHKASKPDAPRRKRRSATEIVSHF
ncbi:helix-turn-helix domain-containing protein [Rhodopirellula bahusiensis]|uniref:DNA-binding protein n=1 Tax=Rhodopirellula bahusiensis TaxID=2014065 RepID=A0A2G1VYH0_9BACT|nr:helix-turn-helix domain-containing protein [Rhodopirellula bahusiensis]PHQ31670.1 DNA-binding protein [Rhodopirellula bahusiensis]